MSTILQQSDLIRKCSYSGAHYPADPVLLAETIDRHFSGSPKSDLAAKVTGMIIPWKEDFYDNDFPVNVFSFLKKHDYKTIILLAPAQNAFFNHASIFHGSAYDTPLGKCYLDLPLAAKLGGIHPQVVLSGSGHVGGKTPEIMIESVLPAFQRMLRDFEIIPIVVGSQERGVAVALGEVLAVVENRSEVLLAAISDLELLRNSETERKSVEGIEDALVRLDWKTLDDRLSSKPTTGNAGGVLIALLYACRRLGGVKHALVSSATTKDFFRPAIIYYR